MSKSKKSVVINDESTERFIQHERLGVSLSNEGKGIDNADLVLPNELDQRFTDRLQLAEKEKRSGDWVYNMLEMDKDHKHVAKKWVEQCISWDTLLDKLSASEKLNRDVYVPLSAVDVVRDVEGAIAMKLGVEGQYALSGHAGEQLAGQSYTQLGGRLLGLAKDDVEQELLFRLFEGRWEVIKEQWKEKEHKTLYFRLRENGRGNVIRAMLSDSYASIDHKWLAEIARAAIGEDGLVSHFDEERFLSTGGEYVRYNVLIPDSVRVEADSDFGGMMNITNSEVGTGRYSILPSIFRSVCSNGLIWGSTKEKRFRTSGVHKGAIDRKELAISIVAKLNQAIPLIAPSIDRLLKLKELACDHSGQAVALYVAKEVLKLTKSEVKGVFKAYAQEPALGNNAYAVVNAITRFAQTTSTLEQQQAIENQAGLIMEKWNDKPAAWRAVNDVAKGYDITSYVTDLQQAI